MQINGIKALLFDVFGTVVDYRGSIINEGERLNREKGLHVDWASLADDWHARYRPSMDRVMSGELPWMNLDALHRQTLDELLSEYAVDEQFDEQARVQLNLVWHRLLPWPDSIPGLTHLRSRFTLATLSNGNVALLVNMAKYSALPWDCILSAELARVYKPDARVYLMAVDLLGLKSHEVMMVAAHPYDLQAAATQGLRTAYVPRPLEHGLQAQGSTPETASETSFDIIATDFIDLAHQLTN